MSLRVFLASVSFGLSLWMTASYLHQPTLLLPLNSQMVTASANDLNSDEVKLEELEEASNEMTSLGVL